MSAYEPPATECAEVETTSWMNREAGKVLDDSDSRTSNRRNLYRRSRVKGACTPQAWGSLSI